MIADIFTANVGRISLLARGIKSRNKKQSFCAMPQPFTRFYFGWSGRSDLKTLTHIEADKSLPLQGKHLFCGLYANELLVRLLKHQMPFRELFNLYEWLITALSEKVAPEPYLRLFEKILLAQLGYGLPLQFEAETFTPIKPDQYYTYDPRNGFSLSVESRNDLPLFPGWLLLSYGKNHITDVMLPLLKRLNRMAFTPLLGEKPLKSRSLFHVYSAKKC